MNIVKKKINAVTKSGKEVTIPYDHIEVQTPVIVSNLPVPEIRASNKLVLRAEWVERLPSGLMDAVISDARFWVHETAESEIAALTDVLRQLSPREGLTDEHCRKLVVDEAISRYKRHAPELVSLIEAHPNDRWIVVEVDAPGYSIVVNEDGTERIDTDFTFFDS